MAAVEPVKSRHRIAVYLAPESEHVARPGAEFDVMAVYRALNSSRLVRALEMSRQAIAVLIDLDEFPDGLAVFNVFRVNRPLAPDVVGRSFWWRLLRPGKAADRDHHEDQQQWPWLRASITHI